MARCSQCHGKGWYAYRHSRGNQRVNVFDPNSPFANAQGWVRVVCSCPDGRRYEQELTPVVTSSRDITSQLWRSVKREEPESIEQEAASG